MLESALLALAGGCSFMSIHEKCSSDQVQSNMAQLIRLDEITLTVYTEEISTSASFRKSTEFKCAPIFTLILGKSTVFATSSKNSDRYTLLYVGFLYDFLVDSEEGYENGCLLTSDHGELCEPRCETKYST